MSDAPAPGRPAAAPAGPLTAAAPDGLEILPVRGLPDFRPGDDLAAAIADAAPWLQDGDVLVVTSKVLSKTEGRLVPSPTDPQQREALRRQLIEQQTVRLVAQIGRTRIVENALGIVAAAAGIDASNVRGDEIALLPTDPDASAAELVRRFAALGRRVGVVVTDTQGRAWRNGVTDVAIGAAGVAVVDDHRGGVDGHGNELVVTVVAIGDELAAAADLVKGKLSGVPVAVVRGMAAPGSDAAGAPAHPGGGRALLRPAHEDLFRLGTDLAMRLGRDQTSRWASTDDLLDGPLPDDELAAALAALPAGDDSGARLAPGPDGLVVALAPTDDPVAAAAAGALLQQLRTVLASRGHGARPVSPPAPATGGPAGRPVAALQVGTVRRPDETHVLHDPHPLPAPS